MVMGVDLTDDKSDDSLPVGTLSWTDCQEFLKKLNSQAPSGWRFALPTEAQWEYACRAGTTGAYGGTGRLEDMGWFESNSGRETHPVAQKKPNAWGLYDMHGNVWEWCSDWSGPYPAGESTDPTGSASGRFRELRGGNSVSSAQECRSANRNANSPFVCYGGRGLRLLALHDGP